MKILILGSKGRLGYDLANYLELKHSDYLKIIRSTRLDFNLAKHTFFNNYISDINPDFIINCAAFTNISLAEKKGIDAFSINSFFVKKLAKTALDKNIPIIHFSTEHIFDGEKSSGYLEEDFKNPINKYGLSKFWGELFINKYLKKFYIFRTSWLLSYTGENFITKIIAKQNQKIDFNVVSDQIGIPVTSDFISQNVANILIKYKTNPLPYGTFHLTPSGVFSRYQLANATLKIASKLNILKKGEIFFPSKIKSSEYSSKVIYPLNGVLSSRKIKEFIDIKMNDSLYNLEYFIRKKYIK